MEVRQEPVSAEAKEAVATIRKFVTRIWENPLIDEATRKTRRDGLNKANDIIRNLNVSDSDYAGFLVGGLRWGESQGGDIDILFYVPKNTLESNFIRYQGKVGLTLMNQDVDPVRVISPKKEPLTEIKPAEAFAYLNFLTTPDEYVIGSKTLAKAARLEAVRLAEKNPKFWEEVGRQFTGWFINYFRAPDITQDDQSPVYKSAKNRLEKVMPRIEKRARRSKISDYQEAFIKSLDNFKLPSLETFKLGLEATGGELRMIETYKAQGI